MFQKTRKTPSSSTPVDVESAPSSAASSPLSPTRTSRLHEKTELQHLNDRLAAYIDRVRFLETDNARLQAEVQTTQEIITRETTNLKTIYEHELNDARKLLDETARDKAKLEIDVKRLWEENDELKNKLDKISKALTVAENNARTYEARAAELTSKYNTLNAERKKAVDENKDLKKEVERLQKALADTRESLDEEILARVDLENVAQSLREELTLRDSIHTQELQETRTRRQVDIHEIDGKLSEEYEAKLQQYLQELRDQYEDRLRASREEIDTLYNTKIRNLQHAVNSSSDAAKNAVEELKASRVKIDSLNSRISELEGVNNALSVRIRDLEKQLDSEKELHADEIASREAEIGRLRKEMEQMLQDYQDLTDIKISLAMELAAYDKLLKGEESRLNLTGSSESAGHTPYRPGSKLGQKRKRTMIEETMDKSVSDYYVGGTAKGDIEISKIDPDGKFVTLHNKGKKEIAIGGWQLIRQAGNNETSFKFHRSVKIDAGATVTVWSSDTNADHEPPANIVMKSQKWFTGDNVRTILLNGDGEEVATHERIKQKLSTRAAKIRATSGSRGAVEEVDSSQGKGEENCLIM